MSNKVVISSVIVLLLLHFALISYCINKNAPTCDEIAHHVASGYSYLVTGDFRMNPANPPLVREISALPLLFLKLNLPASLQAWRDADSPVFGRQFFYEVKNDPDLIIFWARVPIAILSVILGFLVYSWSSALFGYRGGLLSLALYSFSPNIIAHAGLATVDLGTTLFIFAATFSFWGFMNGRSGGRAVLTGFLFGLALASKYTSIFLLPIFMLLSIKRVRFFQGLRDILLISLIGLVTLSACYFFEAKPLIKDVPDVQEKINYLKEAVKRFDLDRVGLNEARVLWIAQNVPVPLRTYFIGLAGVVHQSAIGGYRTFLLGSTRDAGFWYYFIIAFLVKTTLPVLVLLFCSIAFLFKRDKNKMSDILFLIIPAVVLFIVVSGNKGQVGIRHLLPVYPFIFVLIGILGGLQVKKHMGTALFLIVILLQLSSLMTSFPYPIAYFNEIAGGPDNGYRILRDSNLDWGQGLKALKRYMDANGINSVKLYYFGTADPAYYKISYDKVAGAELEAPHSGIYAISAQYLDTVRWTKKYEPIAKIAHSIFIYKIR